MSGANEGGDDAPASFEDDAPKEDMFAPLEAPPKHHDLQDEFNKQEENNDGEDDFDLGEDSFPEPTPVMAFASPPEESESQKDEYEASDAAEEYGASDAAEARDNDGADCEPSESQDEVMPDEY